LVFRKNPTFVILILLYIQGVKSLPFFILHNDNPKKAYFRASANVHFPGNIKEIWWNWERREFRSNCTKEI
jgi:hypothetical protein